MMHLARLRQNERIAALAGICAHTCRRTLARAVWIFISREGLTSSRARHTNGGDATAPSTPTSCRSTSM